MIKTNSADFFGRLDAAERHEPKLPEIAATNVHPVSSGAACRS